jgi:hypothetical protein
MSASRKRIDFYEASLTRCFKDMLLRVKRIESDFDHNYERFSLRLSKNMIEGLAACFAGLAPSASKHPAVPPLAAQPPIDLTLSVDPNTALAV